MQTKDRIIDTYGPQLGEFAWHSLHVDNCMATMSEQHAASILRVVDHCRLRPIKRPIRILEVGAYAHFGVHQAAAALAGVSVAHDVSPTSLHVGLEGAHAAGIKTEATLIAGDFHNLPFSTGYFDVVFCASSIHHTFRPWRPLQEMMRVLRLSGALQLENEPIGQALSFYGFRSNRTEEHSPFEAELAQRGLLFTFSSPFPGSRPESLFGMIEHDRMPLDIVLGPLSVEGEFASLQVVPQLVEFEQRILALPCDIDLEASLATLLLTELQTIRPFLTDCDRLLGVIPAALRFDRRGPFACCDAADGIGCCGQRIPGVAARGDDGVVGVEHAVAELVAAQVGPDVFDRFSMMPLYAGFLKRSGEECDPVFSCLSWSSSAAVIFTIQIC